MKKGKKILIRLGIVLASILLFLLIINIIAPSKVLEDNPFINTGDTPMVCAHRGGKTQNPQNTLKAYKAAVYEYNVDILETDLWLTKDNRLVCIHNETLNETSDVEEITNDNSDHLVGDYTLEELYNFNFGYKFKDTNKDTPYKNLVSLGQENRKDIIYQNDLRIITIEELFEEFYYDYKDLLFIVEIKNSGQRGKDAARIFTEILNEYKDYKNRVVVGTFNDEVEAYLNELDSSIMRGASTGVAAKFIVTQLLKVNLFYNTDVACLQLPIEMLGLDLSLDTYIKRAHRRNIAVQYWTINDEDEMRLLIEKKVDAIMTDDLELLTKVVNEYKEK